MCSEGIYDRYIYFYTDFAFKRLFGTEIHKLPCLINGCMPSGLGVAPEIITQVTGLSAKDITAL